MLYSALNICIHTQFLRVRPNGSRLFEILQTKTSAMTMTTRPGSNWPLLATDQASFDMDDTYDNVYNDNEERNPSSPSNTRADRVMFTSLCAAFSNLAPIVPPVVRRHSSRWRIFLSIVIGIMTFSASFAHLRFLMKNGGDRRVEERNHSLRSLRFFGGNPIQPPAQLEKGDVSTNPRVLLGATITTWTLWGVLVATHPVVKRWTVAVGDGSERAILTCVLFIIACILTHWTRIRYGEAATEAVK